MCGHCFTVCYVCFIVCCNPAFLAAKSNKGWLLLLIPVLMIIIIYIISILPWVRGSECDFYPYVISLCFSVIRFITVKCAWIKLFCRYIANRVFIALANGTVAVFQRPSSKQQFLLKLILFLLLEYSWWVKDAFTKKFFNEFLELSVAFSSFLLFSILSYHHYLVTAYCIVIFPFPSLFRFGS